MLAKKYRLPIQTAIAKRGKEIRSVYFLIKIFAGSLPYSRFWVILKKGIVKKSTDRNRVKRIIFETIRKSGFPLKISGADVLIIISASAVKLPKDELAEELIKNLSKL